VRATRSTFAADHFLPAISLLKTSSPCILRRKGCVKPLGRPKRKWEIYIKSEAGQITTGFQKFKLPCKELEIQIS
jgi:hypothetical protein